MSAQILFYDITSTNPTPWSGNTWKTRYALNYKGIPYKTVWIEYSEIEARSREVGASPTRKKPDGSPNWTLPMIHDLSTGAVVADSTKIAAYLDATYPDTPRLMPPGTTGLLRSFEAAALSLLSPTLYQYIIPGTYKILYPPGQAALRRKREAMFGKRMEDITPKGEEDVIEWKKVKDVFGTMDEWIRANGEGSAYIMGDAPCYVDMWMAAYVQWVKQVVPDKWEDMKLWHEGRWATLLHDFEKYETVV
ncbi:Glutathione S-transferase-like protein ustS [Mycena venus]|uniref:Glutathione S-transferase-like protein ustS n=1 Tax=Mycena venus TaxID=2733690 RepID=A0A8H7CXM4_9AGAR|nr:Glutathione S-transferase-like protein ustS [Mycena venus]